MAFVDDWSIDTVSKTIQHVSGATVYTVNELYSFLMSEFDDWDLMPTQVPMRANTPNIYSWINGWQMADETSYEFLSSGAIQDAVNEDTYVNIQTIGTIEAGSNIYIYRSDGTKITSWWGTDHVDILVKVKAAGTLISSGTMSLFVREYGNLYDHFDLDASSKLVLTVALASADSISNDTAEGIVAGYTDIGFTFGPITRDLLNGNGLQPYDLDLDCNGRTLKEVFEYTKYLTRNGSVFSLDGTPGERYTSVEPITFTINKGSPFGTFAGGNWFLSQGIWLTNYTVADEENFSLIDSNGVQQAPPLNIGFGLSGLQNGSKVIIYQVSDGSIVETFESTGTSIQHRYTYSAPVPVRIVVMHLDYDYQEFNATMTDIDTVLPIVQDADPLYLDV